MDEAKISIGRLFESLQERTKELNCLYAIEEILRAPGKTPEDICRAIVCALPPGMQYPEACRIKIDLYGHTYCSPGFSQSPRILTADINVRDKRIGAIEIHYTTDGPAGSSLFLKEEHQLVKTVANRLGHYMTCHQLRCLVEGVQSAREELTKVTEHRWRVVLELLRRTDQDLFHRIAQKMLNQLCWHGIGPAQQLVRADTGQLCDGETVSDDPNRPRRRASWSLSPDTINAIFNIAAEFVPDEDILACIRKWIQEDKMGFLVQVVNRHLTLPVVADAIRRYQRSGLPPSSALSPVSWILSAGRGTIFGSAISQDCCHD
jgi:pyruvate,water dikinase